VVAWRLWNAPSDHDAMLRRLQAMGIRVSIDDFGTYHSSLAYLQRFPINRIKIDRPFVHEMDTDAKQASIVNAVLLIAKSFEYEVTAEGVEREEELAFLRERGCAHAQGWLFSKAVEPAAFAALLHEGHLPVRARPAAAC
jgi:EAL domain-containing protein (putative c-di-GMP-specific phosphodiesterase class I)